MVNCTLDIQEDIFVKKSTTSYDLSILVGMDRFFYAIFDAQQHLLVLRSYFFEQKTSLDTLKEALQGVFIKDKLLQLSYANTKLAFINNRFTLVPERLYDAHKNLTYLQQLTDLPETVELKTNVLATFDTHLVFALEHNLFKLVNTSFPTAKLYHCITPFLLGCGQVMNHQQGRHIFLNVKQGLLQVALFDGDKLLFSNGFYFQTSQDFIYYVMLVFDQFQLKPESVPVHLMGMIERDSEIYRHLFRYVRHLDFMLQPSFVRFGTKMNEVKKYLYYDLFCLKLCE